MGLIGELIGIVSNTIAAIEKHSSPSPASTTYCYTYHQPVVIQHITYCTNYYYYQSDPNGNSYYLQSSEQYVESNNQYTALPPSYEYPALPAAITAEYDSIDQYDEEEYDNDY
jgi:hypothetical protein